MDVSLFADEMPGQLVTIGSGQSGFVPAALPPNWDFPERLWPLLAEARHRLGVLEGLGRNLPNPQILVRPLQQREALRSSSLEGTFATPQELLLFEMSPREPKSNTDRANAWLEVFNYSQALRIGSADDEPLTASLVRQLHEVLMRGVRGKDQSPGQFRSGQVHIGHDMRFIPPPPTHLQGCLDSLFQYTAREDRPYDRLVDCFLIHYQFETIHPFFDGNGRVGRLLLAIMIKQWCGFTKPWLYMSAYFDRYKDEYIDRLFNVSAQAQWEDWIAFCIRGVHYQADDTIRRCNELLAIREDFAARVREIPGGSIRLSTIVDGLFENPMVRPADLHKALDVSYPTAKADIDKLLAAGIVRELAGARIKTFYAPQILDVAFAEPEG